MLACPLLLQVLTLRLSNRNCETLDLSDLTGGYQMNIEFSGKIWFWKGPAPWYFVTIPAEQCHDLSGIARLVTYGWGMIPVQVKIGKTEWKTSLFPKDGRYLLPIKASVQKAEDLDEGDTVTVRLAVLGR